MNKIIFKDGIPAFEEYKNYQIEIDEDEGNVFHILQSLDEPDLSFVIINPFIFKKDYDFKITDSTIEKLEIEDVEDIAVYTMVNIKDDDIKNMTVNLLAPIIINIKNNLAKQIVLSDTDYPTKYKLIESGE